MAGRRDHPHRDIAEADFLVRPPDTVDRAGARPGLLFISGVVGLMAMAGMRAINLKRILTPWLLLGLLPAVLVGLYYRLSG